MFHIVAVTFLAHLFLIYCCYIFAVQEPSAWSRVHFTATIGLTFSEKVMILYAGHVLSKSYFIGFES